MTAIIANKTYRSHPVVPTQALHRVKFLFDVNEDQEKLNTNIRKWGPAIVETLMNPKQALASYYKQKGEPLPNMIMYTFDLVNYNKEQYLLVQVLLPLGGKKPINVFKLKTNNTENTVEEIDTTTMPENEAQKLRDGLIANRKGSASRFGHLDTTGSGKLVFADDEPEAK